VLASPVRDESGRVGGVFCIVSETTRRVVDERRLRALRDLGNICLRQSANRMKDELLAMLGHELRNPLSPMRTALEVMRLRSVRSREHDILPSRRILIVDDNADAASTLNDAALERARIRRAPRRVRGSRGAHQLLRIARCERGNRVASTQKSCIFWGCVSG
jgi:signal transduction histidine kinase